MSAAEVLAQHEWRGGFLGCGCGWNWPEERTHFCGEDERIAKAHTAHQLDALKAAGWLFTPEDARLFRLAIDWIASELRDQDIPPSEYVGTRTFLNEMITRFDQYAEIAGGETTWSQT